MALVHARISSVYWIVDSKSGYLNTNCKLHCITSLNHKFEAFRMDNREEMDKKDLAYLTKDTVSDTVSKDTESEPEPNPNPNRILFGYNQFYFIRL